MSMVFERHSLPHTNCTPLEMCTVHSVTSHRAKFKLLAQAFICIWNGSSNNKRILRWTFIFRRNLNHKETQIMFCCGICRWGIFWWHIKSSLLIQNHTQCKRIIYICVEFPFQNRPTNQSMWFSFRFNNRSKLDVMEFINAFYTMYRSRKRDMLNDKFGVCHSKCINQWNELIKLFAW